MDGWTEITQGIVLFVLLIFGMRFVCYLAIGASHSHNHIALKIACSLFVIMVVFTLDKCGIEHNYYGQKFQSEPPVVEYHYEGSAI